MQDPSDPSADTQQASLAPSISLVVVIYNMRREAPRTLHSLSPAYQQGITAAEYEVIVVENGSTEPLEAAFVEALPDNFRYFPMEPPHPSPVKAVNFGLSRARAPVVGVMIDGARIVTPGLLVRALEAASTHPSAVVATLGWYLGCDVQSESLQTHYNQEVEDRLLDGIGWPADGYRLYEIAVHDQSTVGGWFSPIVESNALFMARPSWDALGGYDERFDVAGGGFANLDILVRAADLPGSRLVMLTEEATFHQAHGGIATNASPTELRERVSEWRKQYEQIRGKPFSVPRLETFLYGGVDPHMARPFARALLYPAGRRHRGSAPGTSSLLGRSFNVELWDAHAALEVRRAKDPSPAPVRAAVALAQTCFARGKFPEVAHVCRCILAAVKTHDEAGRLLSMTANAEIDLEKASPRRRASYLSVAAKTEALLGERDEACETYRQALQRDPLCDMARTALAQINLPGPDYHQWLGRIHEWLRPVLYLEIGVLDGSSLALARPPTRAVCVDPEPRINVACKAEFTIVPATSDDFFASPRAPALLSEGIDLAFIDGLHEFMQVVRDFWNVERLCKPGAVVLFHDTIPFDELSASHPQKTEWWTGDVWKIVPFLEACRPDLEIFTIKTAPSGLTVVKGLSPADPEPLDAFQQRAQAFAHLEVKDASSGGDAELNLVSNSWARVRSRLVLTEPAATLPPCD